MARVRVRLAAENDKLSALRLSERGLPITRHAVNCVVAEAGKRAKLKVHPHMLRHACGYHTANEGSDLRTMQDFLVQRDPKHTVRYTRVAGSRFEGIWKR